MIKPPVPALMTTNRYRLKTALSIGSIGKWKRGFSLLELSAALAISSFLLLLIVSFFSQAAKQNRDLLLRLQLQHEIQKVLHLMAKDIARSGFYNADQTIVQSNVELFNHADGSSTLITAANREAANSCLLFWYDLDHSGCVGSQRGGLCQTDGYNATNEIQKELLGYRLKSRMIETRAMYKSGTIQQCTQAECNAYLAEKGCDTRGWVDLLDSDTYLITRLNFSWLAGKKGVLAEIEGSYKQYPEMRYQSAVVIPIFNRLYP